MEMMTIFYNKETGTIETVFTGEQSMSVYGIDAASKSKIIDFVITEFDEYLFRNLQQFSMDIDKKIPYLTKRLSRYI